MDERTRETGRAGEEPLRQALLSIPLLADLAEGRSAGSPSMPKRSVSPTAR